MKIWAPPLSWLTLVDQERGGDFFCPPFKDQPVDNLAEIYVRSTVKNNFSQFQNFCPKVRCRFCLFSTKMNQKSATLGIGNSMYANGVNS